MDDAARLPGRPGVHHRQLRGQAPVLPGRRHRPPGGLRHGQRHGGHGRRAALPLHRLHHRGGLPGRRSWKRSWPPSPAPAARAARASSAPTPRWWKRARPTACSSTPPASAARSSKNRCIRARVRPGDVVLINGPLGLHGISVLTARGEFGLQASIRSDVAPLWGLIRTCRALDVPFMRDPTRGGLAQTLNELAHGKNVRRAHRRRTSCPFPKKWPRSATCSASTRCTWPTRARWSWSSARRDADKALKLLRRHPLGKGARRIGEITAENPGRVVMATRAGSERIVMPPVGEILPRIC